jgi:hypothetical protein
MSGDSWMASREPALDAEGVYGGDFESDTVNRSEVR